MRMQVGLIRIWLYWLINVTPTLQPKEGNHLDKYVKQFEDHFEKQIYLIKQTSVSATIDTLRTFT